jgi:hypothetical protein
MKGYLQNFLQQASGWPLEGWLEMLAVQPFTGMLNHGMD